MNNERMKGVAIGGVAIAFVSFVSHVVYDAWGEYNDAQMKVEACEQALETMLSVRVAGPGEGSPAIEKPKNEKSDSACEAELSAHREQCVYELDSCATEVFILRNLLREEEE